MADAKPTDIANTHTRAHTQPTRSPPSTRARTHPSQDVPVADAKPDDIADLLGGALFKALFKWMLESGPVYLLPTGPASSFLVVSDPAAAKHVLRASDNPQRPIYDKGLVAEVCLVGGGGGGGGGGVGLGGR